MTPNRVHIGSWNDGTATAGYDTPRSGGPARRRVTSTWLWDGRALARWSAVAAGSAVIVLVLGAIALTVLVDVDAVTPRLAARASAVLNRPVHVAGARITFLPRPGVRIENVRVDNLPGFQGPPLASAAEVELRIAWMPLLRGVVLFDRAHLSGLSLHAGVDVDGTSNFGDLVPSGWAAAADSSGTVRLALGRITAEGSTLSYRDDVSARALMAVNTEGELEISEEPDGPGWTVLARAMPDSLHLKWAGEPERIVRLTGPDVTFTLTGDETFSRISVIEGTVSHDLVDATFTGHVEALDGREPRVLLQLENPDFDASRLTALLSARTRAERQPYLEGSLAFSLRVSGPLGAEGPRAVGSVTVREGGFRLNGESLAEDVSGTVSVDADSLTTRSVRGVLASGPFDLVAGIDRVSGHGLATVRARPDLAVLQRVGLLGRAPSLSGDAVVSLALDGSLDSLDALRPTGTIGLRGVRAEPAGLAVPVYVPGAELSLDGSEIRWPESEILVGEASLVTEGRVQADVAALWWGESTPDVDVDVRGEVLDLSAILPSSRGPDAPSYPRIAFAHLAGEPMGERSTSASAQEAGFSRPRDLPMRGVVQLSLHELAYRDLVLDSVDARLLFTDSTLTVDEASFRVWGGLVDGSLRMQTGDALDEPFRLTLRGDSLNAADFLSKFTPVDARIEGVLALDVDVQGLTDLDLLPVPGTPRGHARLTISDGSVSDTGLNLALSDFLGTESWHDVPFQTWSSDLRFAERSFEIVSTRLVGESGELRSAGSVGMDGTLDLSVGLSIAPERLGDVSLRRTGIVAGMLRRLEEAGEPLELGLRVGGSLAGPTIEPDALAVTEVTPGPGG